MRGRDQDIELETYGKRRQPTITRDSDDMGYMEKVANELKSASFWRDMVSEFVATFFLVSVQCMLPLSWETSGNRAVLIGLGMGFIIVAMAESLGEFGGAHMNPAVTISLVASLKVTVTRGIVYVGIQCVGAIAGAAFVSAVTPGQYREGLATTVPSAHLSSLQAVAVEAWLTSILLFAVHGATNASRRKVYMPAIPIGLVIALDIMTGINYTGASMNPARSLGPAVIMGIWERHWVYWVGPISGGLIATVLYHYIFDRIGRNDEKYDMDSSNT